MLGNQFLLPVHHELVVDLFAGGGGASTGIEQAIGRHVDVAVNHDREAISLHTANHPQTRHFCSDVFEVDPLTVTTKDRFGLVTVRGQAYQIADIGLRMLTPRELYRAQGFPESYAIDRGAAGEPITKTAQVRMCGNSVCPPLARAIVAANYAEQHAAQRRAA